MTTPNPAKAYRFEVKYSDTETDVFWAEFGWSAFAEIEAHFDVTAEEADETAQARIAARLKNPGFRDMLFLFKAGMRKHQPDMTDDEVVEVMDELGKGGAMRVITEAFKLAFDENKPKGDKEAEAGEAKPDPQNRAQRRRARATSATS